MAIPDFPRRRRFWTVMIVVAACAVGLGADRGPIDRLMEQLRAGDAQARSQAALRIGLLGPRAAFAVGALDSALDDPDPLVRANAMYSLVRLGSRSPRLLPILAERIEATPVPQKWHSPVAVTSRFADPPKGWTLTDGGLSDNDLRNLGSPRSYEAALLLPRLGGGAAAARSILLDFLRDGDDIRPDGDDPAGADRGAGRVSVGVASHHRAGRRLPGQTGSLHVLVGSVEEGSGMDRLRPGDRPGRYVADRVRRPDAEGRGRVDPAAIDPRADGHAAALDILAGLIETPESPRHAGRGTSIGRCAATESR